MYLENQSTKAFAKVNDLEKLTPFETIFKKPIYRSYRSVGILV